jgi:hypothetical protein
MNPIVFGLNYIKLESIQLVFVFNSIQVTCNVVQYFSLNGTWFSQNQFNFFVIIINTSLQ